MLSYTGTPEGGEGRPREDASANLGRVQGLLPHQLRSNVLGSHSGVTPRPDARYIRDALGTLLLLGKSPLLPVDLENGLGGRILDAVLVGGLRTVRSRKQYLLYGQLLGEHPTDQLEPLVVVGDAVGASLGGSALDGPGPLKGADGLRTKPLHREAGLDTISLR